MTDSEVPLVSTQRAESFGLTGTSSPHAAPAVGPRRSPGGGGVRTACWHADTCMFDQTCEFYNGCMEFYEPEGRIGLNEHDR